MWLFFSFFLGVEVIVFIILNRKANSYFLDWVLTPHWRKTRITKNGIVLMWCGARLNHIFVWLWFQVGHNIFFLLSRLLCFMILNIWQRAKGNLSHCIMNLGPIKHLLNSKMLDKNTNSYSINLLHFLCHLHDRGSSFFWIIMA